MNGNAIQRFSILSNHHEERIWQLTSMCDRYHRKKYYHSVLSAIYHFSLCTVYQKSVLGLFHLYLEHWHNQHNTKYYCTVHRGINCIDSQVGLQFSIKVRQYPFAWPGSSIAFLCKVSSLIDQTNHQRKCIISCSTSRGIQSHGIQQQSRTRSHLCVCFFVRFYSREKLSQANLSLRYKSKFSLLFWCLLDRVNGLDSVQVWCIVNLQLVGCFFLWRHQVASVRSWPTLFFTFLFHKQHKYHSPNFKSTFPQA